MILWRRAPALWPSVAVNAESATRVVVWIPRRLLVGNTSDATAIWPERCFAPLLGMVAKPLGVTQARVDLVEQITHAVLSSLGHIPGAKRLQSTRRFGYSRGEMLDDSRRCHAEAKEAACRRRIGTIMAAG
jgi:hypothetical protein